MTSSIFVFTALLAVAASAKVTKYYYDAERDACFATSATKGKFDSLKACQSTLPLDKSQCSANSSPVKRANGDSVCYPDGDFREQQVGKCPKGSTCMYGFTVGMCCDDKITADYKKDSEAKCDGVKTARPEPNDEFNRVLFGKTCADDFCPDGTKCVSGKYLAWCC